MWKAEKIELIPNKETPNRSQAIYFEDCFSLKINGHIITNTISDPNDFYTKEAFPIFICDYCGFHCDNGGMIAVRKHLSTIVILPDFNSMETFEEYDSEDGKGDSDCPPHEWFEKGILVVEGKELEELVKLVPGLALENVQEVSKTELDCMLQWESLVKTKPKGFIHPANLKIN